MELLITIGILSVLAAMALPSFAPILDRLHVMTTAAHFQEAMNLARAEAIRRRMRVDLLPMRDKNWATGWQVLIDADNNQLANTVTRYCTPARRHLQACVLMHVSEIRKPIWPLTLAGVRVVPAAVLCLR